MDYFLIIFSLLIFFFYYFSQIKLEDDDSQEIWWELYDDNHARSYYYNTITEKTVWDRPLSGQIIVPVIEDDIMSSEDDEEISNDNDLDYLDNISDGEYESYSKSGEEKEDNCANTDTETKLEGKEILGNILANANPSFSMTNLEAGARSTLLVNPHLAKSLCDSPSNRLSCPVVSKQEYPLLTDWEEHFEKDSNCFYYINMKSGQRTYDRDVACGIIPMVDIEDDNEDDILIPQDDIPREYPSIEEPKLSPQAKAEMDTKRKENIDNNSSTPPVSAPPKPNQKQLEKLQQTSNDGIKSPKRRKKKSKSRRDKRGKNRQKSSQSNQRRSLPSGLQNDINMFQLVGYAEKYFETHKRGIFRRQVPVKEMLCWSKETIPTSLTRLTSESAAKEAVKNFKAVQMYCGDRPTKNENIPLAQDIIGRAINRPELRDEIYCQLCKQSCFNPNKESNHKVWELFVLSSIYFPPSRDLEKWLCSYIKEHLKLEYQDGDEKLPIFAKYVLKKLEIIIKAGPRGRVPAPREIERHRGAPFSKSVFGVTLEDVMDLQTETHPKLLIPKIVVVLTESVASLDGINVEGIFRVPGDTEQVYALRIQLDNGNYDVNVDDPSTPASLLKLWLRELEEPLVPVSLYDECINSCMEDENNIEGAIATLDKFPEINRLTSLYVVEFLKRVSENHEINKMSVNNIAMVFAPNFLRCPSSDPQVILNNTKYEQQWLRALMNGINSKIDIGEL